MQDAEVRTGSLGFGNKGAVLVRLRAHDEPLCAICAHLASGEVPGDDMRRVADFVNVTTNGQFDGANNAGAAGDASSAVSKYRCGAPTRWLVGWPCVCYGHRGAGEAGLT
jgi:hypothetical protein